MKKKTFANSIRSVLAQELASNKNFFLGGQLIKYGVAGLTTGLYQEFKDQIITYPVSESLMNSSALGLALAKKKICIIHVRIDFLASGMCALVNHIPIWYKKGYNVPITLICQVGKGMGQGPQHSKDLTIWFKKFEGWNVEVPNSPSDAEKKLKKCLKSNRPNIYVIRRELFNETSKSRIKIMDKIKLCGASKYHEKKFYKNL